MNRFSNALMCLLTAGILMTIAASVTAQQVYPGKPIRMIVPYPPGGGSDALARLLGQKLTESWGQQLVVDNRPGGNTIIGTEALAKAPPDGYTILLSSSDHVLLPILLKAPYDPIKDFAPVTTLADGEFILVLNPSVPANNLQELIALAKSKPGQLNYATYGSGSRSHLGTEMFSIMVGIQMQHIPYKGSGPAVTDLLGGQVQLHLGTSASVIPHIKSGKLRAIAISGETRKAAVPQVPTFAEAGLPGFDVKYWYSILAPAGTPKEIVDKLAIEIARILIMPDVTEKLASQGMNPFISTPEQLAALMKAELARFTSVIKTANIKMEN